MIYNCDVLATFLISDAAFKDQLHLDECKLDRSFEKLIIAGMIISEASRRICATRAQQQAKPGRQIITFMLFANITLWVLDTFMTHRDITQGVQTQFFGLLAWGIISRISLPLLIFYRFHSCVVLVEIWKNTYRTKESL